MSAPRPYRILNPAPLVYNVDGFEGDFESYDDAVCAILALLSFDHITMWVKGLECRVTPYLCVEDYTDSRGVWSHMVDMPRVMSVDTPSGVFGAKIVKQDLTYFARIDEGDGFAYYVGPFRSAQKCVEHLQKNTRTNGLGEVIYNGHGRFRPTFDLAYWFVSCGCPSEFEVTPS